MALLFLIKGIKTNTPFTKYYYTAVINTLMLKKSANGLRANIIRAIPRDGAFP